MRTLIGALTMRGTSFIAAGCAAVVCGLGLGEADLVRIGVLLLALPVLSAVAAGRARFRLACFRQLVPVRTPVGHPVEVRLRLSNPAKLRTRLLLAEDATPRQFGGSRRFVLDSLEPGGSRELSYQIRPEIRGKYTIGPLRVRIADAFGLVELGRSFAARNALVVTPRLVPLPQAGVAGGRLGEGVGGLGTVAATGEDDVALRGYRDGDDLRRVHWRSTARYGELMVRREEQRWLDRTCLFLDTRRWAYRGGGTATASFELAVSAAASIGVAAAARGTHVQLVTDTGELAGVDAAADALLDMLAVIRPSRGATLDGGLATLGSARFGVIIAVTGELSAEDARRLAAGRRGHGTAMALLISPPHRAAARPQRDVAGGDSDMARDDAAVAAEILTAAGWRVATVAASSDLPTAWQDLHRPADLPFARPPARPAATQPATAEPAARTATVADPRVATAADPGKAG